MDAFIILPDQLFYHKKYLDTVFMSDDIYLMEDPEFFTKYTYHRAKLILHRASMMEYYEYLKKTIEETELKQKPRVHYITCGKILKCNLDDNTETTSDEKQPTIKPPSIKPPSIKPPSIKPPPKRPRKVPTIVAAQGNTVIEKAPKKRYTSTTGSKNFLDYIEKNITDRKISMWRVNNTHSWGKRLTEAKFHGVLIKFYESPAFILPFETVITEYAEGKKYRMSNFYISMRKKYTPWLNPNGKPLCGKWSFDEDAQETYSSFATAVESRKYTSPIASVPLPDNPAYDAAVKYTTRFHSVGSAYRYPINRAEAEMYFEHFLVNNFRGFGPFQDVTVFGETPSNKTLYHSILSSSLNCGLLTPAHVIGKAVKYYSDNAKKQNIPYVSLEAFVRQIIGWREYMRMIYVVNPKMMNNNFFEHKKKLQPMWYGHGGSDGIGTLSPIRAIVADVLRTGYTHHINRLMYLSATMFMSQIDPNQVHRWFMEMFIDSYEWVMAGNVEMGQFHCGGLLSSRPYFSSSAYIIRMSNASSEFETRANEIITWKKRYDSLYYYTLNIHQEKLAHMYFVNNWVRLWKEKSIAEKTKIIELARKTI